MLDVSGRTQLVVLQPTTLCNLDCRYCYLSNRHSKNIMPRSVLDAIGRNVCQSSLIDSLVEVSFHSGEPLLAGITWFEEALDILERSWPPNVSSTYSVQTNAVLINDNWADLFKSRKIRVSLSLDGPEYFNDANRKNWAGRGSFLKVMRGVEALQKHNVPFALLCVLSESNIGFPEELFRFFEKLSPVLVAFNVEETEGLNKESSLQSQAHTRRVEAFFAEYLRLSQTSGFPHRIREFEQLSKFFAASLLGQRICNDVATPFRILCISYSGELSTFSPELADVTDPKFGSFILGNVLSGPPEHVIDQCKLSTIAKEIADGIMLCEQSCDYFRICGGGAPANKIAEHGTFVSTETAYCRNSVKAIATVFADNLISRLHTQSA
jgi:uncharacterized protein